MACATQGREGEECHCRGAWKLQRFRVSGLQKWQGKPSERESSVIAKAPARCTGSEYQGLKVAGEACREGAATDL